MFVYIKVLYWILGAKNVSTPFVIGDADRAENQRAAFPEALTLIRCGGLEYDPGSQNIVCLRGYGSENSRKCPESHS